MCGIVGYIGKQDSKSHILEGLQRLEYRGYDSAGFACLNAAGVLNVVKTKGMVTDLAHKLGQNTHTIDGHVGIGHTRWSTHGIVTDTNSHPHTDCMASVAVVHNGIIENYESLKEPLISSDHRFTSETDSEVIAHLLEEIFATADSLKHALVYLVNQLQGSFGCLFLLQRYPDCLVLIRKRVPLCIGISNGAVFVASDQLAFSHQVHSVIFVPDESFAILTPTTVELYNFAGTALPVLYEQKVESWTKVDKGTYEHYMLKEIHEQPHIIKNIVNIYSSLTGSLDTYLSLPSGTSANVQEIHLLGCGTSWHAAGIGKFFFELIAQVRTQLHVASEFRYVPFFPLPHSLYCALSQSGETLDTLESIHLVHQAKLPTLALTNVASSALARECTGTLLLHAGPEIAVASTKTFTAHIALLFWLAHKVAYEKELITARDIDRALDQLLYAGTVLEQSLYTYTDKITNILAPHYAQFQHAIFLGRHSSYFCAREAALKVQEIAYMFVETYSTGELKHGPLALIDATMPVVLFSSLDEHIYPKLCDSAQQIKSRGGRLLLFAFEGQHELIKLADDVVVLPTVHPLLAPLALTGVLQLFAYSLARVLHRPIDRPRNLAKAVTVE